MDGKFSVGYRDAFVRTVVGLDRETTAAYTLVLEAIGTCGCAPPHTPDVVTSGRVHMEAFHGPGLEPKEELYPEAGEESATKCQHYGPLRLMLGLYGKLRLLRQGLPGSPAETSRETSLQARPNKAGREEGGCRQADTRWQKRGGRGGRRLLTVPWSQVGLSGLQT